MMNLDNNAVRSVPQDRDHQTKSAPSWSNAKMKMLSHRLCSPKYNYQVPVQK